jgi:hypothetical protein
MGMTIDLKSMAVMMPEVTAHPNRTAFRGVLTTVDVPSHRSPSGARGHLVVLTREAAEAALPSLLGMGVDYSPSLDRHDVRRKVGVITRAEITGRNLELGGYLYARDFPEIVEEIAKSGNDRCPSMERAGGGQGYLHGAVEDVIGDERSSMSGSLRSAANQILRLTQLFGRSNKQTEPEEIGSTIRAESRIKGATKGLGMSYEITNVKLRESDAQVWILDKVTFTGAAILHRDKAAYRDTWIELV